MSEQKNEEVDDFDEMVAREVRDLTYNVQDNTSAMVHQRRYYRLLLMHVTSLAIIVILLTALIIQTDNTMEQIRDEKNQILRHLDDSNIAAMRYIDNKVLQLQYNLENKIRENAKPEHSKTPDKQRLSAN